MVMERPRAHTLSRNDAKPIKEKATVIPIALFHETIETYTGAWALIDESMPVSFLSFQILDWLKLPHEPCEERQVQDGGGRLRRLVGKIDLKWVVDEIALDRSETFYVVECEKPTVRLGASAIKDDFVAVNQGGCFPIALEKMTPGMEQNVEAICCSYAQD